MSPGLGVLPLQPVAELRHHRLVLRPLPVVDDQPAGLAGEQSQAHRVLTKANMVGHPLVENSCGFESF